MIEVNSLGFGEVASERLNGPPEDRGSFAGLRGRLGLAGKALGTATLWMTGLCPSYVVLEAASRQPLDVVSSLTLIGLAVSFIYIPLYLTGSPGRRFSTTGLLIGFGLVAGLVGVWTST